MLHEMTLKLTITGSVFENSLSLLVTSVLYIIVSQYYLYLH